MKVSSFNQEFGYELLSSVPHAYQLYLEGKLTETESGPDTKSLYYFSPKHTENKDKRSFENTDKARDASLPYTEIHQYERPKLTFPPYKKIYGGLQYWDKPTLCICNRYATMWGGDEPVNFFDESLLDWMFSNLKELYHIVYFPVSIPMEFEDDEKNMAMNDIEVAMKHGVDVFTHIKGKSWNESMLKIFAGCEHFITMNGGYSILASLFGGTNVIYSKQCYELEFKSFWRWYPNHSDQRCLHVDNYKELKAKIKALYIDKLPQVNVIIKTSKRNYFRGCIESVMEQDYPNINPVVVTTGEESVKYTRKYKARHLEGDWKGRISGYIFELDEDYKFIRKDAVSTLMDGVKEDCINTGRVQLPGKIYGGKKVMFHCSLEGSEGINLLDEVILMKQKNVPEVFEDEIIDEEEERLYDEMLDKMLEDMDRRLDEEEKEYQRMRNRFRKEEFDGKIVVYTCISGAYDTLREVEVLEDGVEYICFTDQNIKSSTWEIRKIPEYLMDLDTIKKSMCIKTMPHLFVDGDISVWIDNGIEVENIRKLVSENHSSNFYSQNERIIIRKHDDCIEKSKEWWYRVLRGDSRLPYIVKHNHIFKDYSDLTTIAYKKKDSTAKIAVLIQMYWIDLWPEFKTYLSNITEEYDLYVALVRDSFPMKDIDKVAYDIHTFKNDANIILVDNRGMDIGAVFMTMKKIIADNKHYDYYLKLHTKKSVDTREKTGKGLGEMWRKELIYSICGSEEVVFNALQLLKLDDVGLIGSKKWIKNIKTHPSYLMQNGPIIKELINLFKMEGVTPKDCVFVGGTMFWINGKIWEQFFKNINIDELYKMLCTGKFTDHKNGTYTHSMERFIGLYTTYNKKRILGL